MGVLADTPSPPYIAVIFTSRRKNPAPGYSEMTTKMGELVAQQPGFLGEETVSSPEAHGITVSYWRDEEAAAAWKRQVEHLAAQAKGKAAWYAEYAVRVARVERDYGFNWPEERTSE